MLALGLASLSLPLALILFSWAGAIGAIVGYRDRRDALSGAARIRPAGPGSANPEPVTYPFANTDVTFRPFQAAPTEIPDLAKKSRRPVRGDSSSTSPATTTSVRRGVDTNHRIDDSAAGPTARWSAAIPPRSPADLVRALPLVDHRRRRGAGHPAHWLRVLPGREHQGVCLHDAPDARTGRVADPATFRPCDADVLRQPQRRSDSGRRTKRYGQPVGQRRRIGHAGRFGKPGRIGKSRPRRRAPSRHRFPSRPTASASRPTSWAGRTSRRDRRSHTASARRHQAITTTPRAEARSRTSSTDPNEAEDARRLGAQPRARRGRGALSMSERDTRQR